MADQIKKILCANVPTSVDGVNARITYMILRIKSVIGGSKERIKSYLHNLSVENRHYTKMASFAVLGALIPLSVLPVIAEQDSTNFKSNVVFSKNSQIVDISAKTPAIVPGESTDQIAVRVAAEEAAKAAQAAEAAKAALVAAKATKTVKKTSSSKVYIDPSSFDGIYQSAGAAYGIDWRILKAVHYVETGASGSTSKRNPSGATGPMQFIPSTWRHYGVDGNGDGVRDITNVEDAIYAAANYLAASGGGVNGYKTALWSYNPSSSYFNKVIKVARSIGF